MDYFVALLVLVLVAAAYTSRQRPRSNGVLDLFGAGFVPYREDRNWPQGVQEEEPRAWSWHDGPDAGPADAPGAAAFDPDANDPTDVPVIVELTAGDASTAGTLGDVQVRRSRWPGRD